MHPLSGGRCGTRTHLVLNVDEVPYPDALNDQMVARRGVEPLLLD